MSFLRDGNERGRMKTENKDKKFYNLMIDGESTKVPFCVDGNAHEFKTTVKPQGCNSGWHEEKCAICGITVGYDSGD